MVQLGIIKEDNTMSDNTNNGFPVPEKPLTREEEYLSAIAGVTSSDDIPEKPLTREEAYLNKIVENGGGGGGGGFTPTDAQLAAMNSGITAEDVEQIDTNKTNISTIGTNVAIADITNTIVAEKGYSILDYSRLYKQGKHVFGTIVIRKNSGYFSNVENIAIATIATANAPERIYLSAGNFSTDVWAISNIGYAFVNSAQAITQPGIIKCKDNATTNNHIILQIDYVTL